MIPDLSEFNIDLSVARPFPGEEITVAGNFMVANAATDGAWVDVALNRQNAGRLRFKDGDSLDTGGDSFDRLFLTNEAQEGASLRLTIGKGGK